MSDIYKEFGVDFLCARHAGPTAAEVRMEREIKRLREQLHLANIDAIGAHAEANDLSARAEALREPLAVYVHAHQTGNSVPPHIEAAARAALEAKP